MKFSFKSFAIGFGCAALSLGAVTYANAASNKTLKACANNSTGVMRYISKGSCKKTESLLSWNQMGPQGLPGSAGVKGDTGAAGVDGKNSAVKISELRTCGDDGATLCAVGVKGPGGGLIFFVDYNNQYPDFDYLEAAPTDADFPDRGPNFPKGGNWAINLPIVCRPELDGGPCSTESIFSGTEKSRTISEINARSIFAGKAMTQLIISKHPGQLKNSYAAGVADEYVSPVFRGDTKSDWFLPSAGAMALMQVNLIENGLGNFSITGDGYWTSSPTGDFPQLAVSWDTYEGRRNRVPVSEINPVRPMRAF